MDIYLVGGAVRDQLLGYPAFDKDWVVVGATAEEMISQGYQPVGQDFPVFIHPTTGEEYALARTERKSGKGYTGFNYHADPSVTLEEDLLRRDLTINAMALGPDKQLIDPYNGQDDLQKKLLRHVSPAFSEDPLRVLRVARFAARYAHLGFSVADETMALMQQLSLTDELEHLTAERVWKEFERALTEQSPEVFLQVLHQCNAIPKVLPELTKALDEQTFIDDFISIRNKTDSSITRFACLLSLTTQVDINHLCTRLRTPNDYKELALQCSQHHKQLAHFDKLAGKEKLEIILQLDLIRRPQRLSQLQRCLDAIHNTVSLDTLGPILDQIAQIQPKQLMAEGLTGANLGEAINNRRLSICQQFNQDA
ncbi:hypothetical protein [Neptuniibacter sp. 1_MG-2023]|uniref:hypothetical protein n=1 Tax=Neptuniibacter sp. 1_MG-2023 TaxID=3062662 RepID=UPI0026E24D59|nr:hypothetical protein [Neptuniibacter sp. 1_MG-2023]MDO6592797.1 hypothetical protein [Neptuniibacter sp. 1_MG-2023]